MTVIKLGENVGVKSVRSFHRSLVKAFRDDADIVIDFSGTRRLDLSIVQVLIAAGREARAGSKTFRMRGASETVRQQLAICGLSR
ncbi:MAG: STAS domain-containing protein [Spirochaetes bacterium]|jgi:anti-anti-sigma regulatory factor|nr:STAS domain-containing protein [Spirochaetota bacterium]